MGRLLIFRPDNPQLSLPAGAETPVEGMKTILTIECSQIKTDVPNQRILWGAFEKIANSGEQEEILLTDQEYELMLQTWEKAIPNAQDRQIGYKWLKTIDDMFLNAPKREDKPNAEPEKSPQ